MFTIIATKLCELFSVDAVVYDVKYIAGSVNHQYKAPGLSASHTVLQCQMLESICHLRLPFFGEFDDFFSLSADEANHVVVSKKWKGV